MKRYSHALRGALILSTAFVPLASVHAAGATAEAPPPPPGAEADVATGGDIIVTARRQDEKIQRVPISIAVIDSKALARGTLSDLKDVQFLAPSLTVSTNNTRNTDNLSLRGVGTTYGTDQAVVAYFAEVPLPGGGGGAGNLFDLGNVQVLNGPQGTLFGRNTTGGAILFEPKRPTDRFEGQASVTYGNYNNAEEQLIVNIPVLPGVLAVRAGIDHRTRDGYTIDAVTKTDYDNLDYTAARVSVLFTPLTGLENLTTFNYYNRNQNGTGSQINLVNPAFYGTAFDAIVAQNRAWGPRVVAYDGQEADKEKIFLVTNRTRYDFSPNVTIKNIVSYATFRSDQRIDVDGSTIPGISYYPTGEPGGLQNGGTPAFNQFTEELQLNAKALNRMLDVTVGIYTQHNTPKANLTAQQNIIFGAPTEYISQGDDLTSLAGYLQGTLDLGALSSALTGLKVTGGIRQTHDHRADYANRYFDLPGLPCEYDSAYTSGATGPNCRYNFTPRSFNATTWTGGLSYQIDQATMAYGTVSRGFKSGGFNLPSPPSSAYSSFGPEHVTSYEIGVKTRTTIGGLPVSGSVALFDDKFSDIQRALLLPATGGFALYVVNASSATIKGAEIQADVNLTRAFHIGARYSYVHSKYGTFIDPLSGNNYTGLPLPYAPENKFSLTAGYTGQAGVIGQLDLAATYAYQSNFRNLDAFDPDIVVPGYGLLSLSAGINNVLNSHTDVSIFATNVTNRTYRVGGGNYYYSLGFTTAIYGEPRMVAARLTYHFGV